MQKAIQSLALMTYRRFGNLIPRGVRNSVYRRLYPPGARKPVMMYVDVVGNCNLRCPSCPAGNMKAKDGVKPMDTELFTKIIQKGKKEYGVFFVGLFNWTEPLLHPQLPELIRIVKREGLQCGLSSNLNVLRDVDEILEAEPDDFRISLSGFSQEIYEQTHVRGDIEKVKNNMKILSEAKHRLRNKKTSLYVYFHKYLNNLHEVDPMRRYSRSLGFDWLESWAYFMPLERVFDLLGGTLPPEQELFINSHLALPLGKALAEAKHFKAEPCSLLDNQLVVDAKGNVNLCCAVYDTAKNGLGSFLDMTPDDLRDAKSQHPTCTHCKSMGLHSYFTYTENSALLKKYDALALANLKESSPTDKGMYADV